MKKYSIPFIINTLKFSIYRSDTLLTVINNKKIPVIIFDEAHLLKNENFYELQIIANFNMDSSDPALTKALKAEVLRIKRPFIQHKLRKHCLFYSKGQSPFESPLRYSKNNQLPLYQIHDYRGYREKRHLDRRRGI